MLTVKAISLAGIENLYEAKSVWFLPAATRRGDEPSPERDIVRFTTPDGGCECVLDGTVFVMNDHGKTVSRYDLGASEVPLISDLDPRMTGMMVKGASGRPVDGMRAA